MKVRNIRQNPSVALVLVDTVNNGQGLIVRGKAELIEEGTGETPIANGVRYVGEERGHTTPAELNAMGDHVIIRIKPEKIIYGD